MKVLNNAFKGKKIDHNKRQLVKLCVKKLFHCEKIDNKLTILERINIT